MVNKPKKTENNALTQLMFRIIESTILNKQTRRTVTAGHDLARRQRFCH